MKEFINKNLNLTRRRQQKMGFGKKKLSRRQIKEIERTREEFLAEIDIFTTKVNLQKGNYYQTNQALYCKPYNKEGERKLKSAINDMDLKNGIIAGKSIKFEEHPNPVNTNLVEYIIKIEEIIIQEFGGLESHIKEKINEYMAKILQILTQKRKPLFK